LSAPPLPPVIVELTNTPIGNNLMLSPLRTPGGVLIQVAARQAAEKTGDARKRDDTKKDDSKGSDNTPSLVEQVAVNSGNVGPDGRRPGEDGKIISIIDKLKDEGIDVKDKTTGDEHVYMLYKDASKTQQTGWGYESLSSSGHNYANIVLPLNSQVVVVVTQDRLTDAFNFSSSGKSQGSIVINQTWK
jgi:hypothetical protein